MLHSRQCYIVQKLSGPETCSCHAEGIDLFLHLRLVDVNTCMPVEGLLLDVWHANATGAYSGVNYDTGNFLRGMVATDADGIATIQTIYPGA